MGEVMKSAGYRTYMVGKWHVARSVSPDGPKDFWPMQRGFEKYYGIITGAANYYDPATLCRGNTFITVENDPEYKPEHYYFTDAIADNAIKFIDEHEKESPDKPFFMYAAFTAAHWPMQAPADEVAKQKGNYDAGYEAIRRARFAKMKKLGIIRDDLTSSPTVGDWTKVNRPWEARNMEVYAAMIHRLDADIGKIIEKLKSQGKLDNTLIFFMEDNGACAETIGRENRDDYATNLKPMGPDELQKHIWPPMQTRDGRPVKTGPEVMAGPADAYISYGENWANASNTPFRKYKHWTNEGGISTPLIVHWPAGIPSDMNNKFVREPSSLIDIMATVADAGGATYPKKYNNYDIKPLAGVSLLPLVQKKDFDRGGPLFWEHESNRAVRDGKWKIVTEGMGPWELYDISVDRAEMNNLADQHPDIVKKMADQWQHWAEQNDVLPLGTWEKVMNHRHNDSKDEPKTKSTVFHLKPGDKLDLGYRPALSHREIRVVANVAGWGKDGVIVSQGGSISGFSLYAKDGKAHLAVRNDEQLTDVESDATIEVGKPVHLVGMLKLDGMLSLRVGKQTPAIANAPGTLSHTPVEGVTVGNDREGRVGPYPEDFKFTGKIKNATISVSEEDKPFPPQKKAGKKGRHGKKAKAEKPKRKTRPAVHP